MIFKYQLNSTENTKLSISFRQFLSDFLLLNLSRGHIQICGFGEGRLSKQRRHDPLPVQWHVVHPPAQRMRHGIADRGAGWPNRALAHTQ